MKFIIFLLLIPCLLHSISLFEIQYTENPGDGAYPSPYAGNTVTTGGIVSGIDFQNGRFFITSSLGGAWNGLYIYNNNQQFSVGDSLIITGNVYEYYGFTEISPMHSYQFISVGNPLPEPVSVSTQDIHTQEAYESVFASVSNANVMSDYDEYNAFWVSDGSENCLVEDSFFSSQNLPDILPLIEDYQFAKIYGIVSYQYGNYCLNPRSIADFYSPENGAIIANDAVYTNQNDSFQLPLKMFFFGSEFEGESYQFLLHYNDNFFHFADISTENTLSENGDIFWEEIESGTVQITFTGNFSFLHSAVLMELTFHALQSGSSEISFSNFMLNESSLQWFSNQPITIMESAEAVGDTITVIQRPLINLPALVTNGQEFEIQCVAPSSTTNWQAELVHKQKTILLEITESVYQTALQRWFLHAAVSDTEIYELYDLRITASNGIDDTTSQSVQVLPHFKTNYSFAHITDSHLPTHFFHEDEEALTDSTEMDDLREVFKDLNIIRPEFVLFTGDIVNEGELEDYQNRRYFSKAQRLMKELEVPVFVVAGNHDIGGWNSTPEPQGTARRTWWRFFGWNYLENPFPIEPYFTQNYSFFYDNTQFIGLESYNNYDSFMYSIYGSDSFTDGQMNWLANEILTPSEQKVLFYHRDFSEQINLSQLNADMALSGHIHSNDGNINQHPYDLSTDATCDGKRSYRIIEVANGQLIPKYTIDAGYSGNKLSLTFQPSNDGAVSIVTATLQNSQPIAFTDVLIKFVMPSNATGFAIENGALWQVDFSEEKPVCYARASVNAYSTTTVTCSVTSSSAETNVIPAIKTCFGYPNPFRISTTQRSEFTVSFSLSQSAWGELSIFNLKGQKIKTLFKGNLPKNEEHHFFWNGTDEQSMEVSSGVYLYRLDIGDDSRFQKMLLIK
jgi:predicted MPP superfamily phosphohydrolase